MVPLLLKIWKETNTSLRAAGWDCNPAPADPELSKEKEQDKPSPP